MISDNTLSEDTVNSLDDDMLRDNASSNLMRESTKYGNTLSDLASMVSANIGQSKTQPTESVDIVCLYLSKLICKIDLFPEKSQANDKNSKELLSLYGTPNIRCGFELKIFGYNINENYTFDFVYPIDIMVNVFTKINKTEKDSTLTKYLTVKSSQIEAETSLDIVLSLWTDKFEKLINIIKSSAKKLSGVLEKKEENQHHHHHAQEINLNKRDFKYEQIDYVFGLEISEIYITLLKENRKSKSQWKFVPLWS